MPVGFQAITNIANPEQAEVRDGSRAHCKKFPFRLSALPRLSALHSLIGNGQ